MAVVEILGREYSRREFLRWFGGLGEAAGLESFTYREGRAGGLRAVRVRTGGGLEYTVLLDRGMDIASCRYRGIPVSFRSPVGETAPCYYEPGGEGWLRSFGGGLLVTCGLRQAGAPAVDGGEELGLHGRIGNTPAMETAAESRWEGDACHLTVRGKVREASTLSTNLLMVREISTDVGENGFAIRDVVRNEGFRREPHMLLYHFNFGHPLLDENARLVTRGRSVPRDATAASREEEVDRYLPPTPGYPDTVYYHDLEPRADGWCAAALVNRDRGLGAVVEFEKTNLPHLIQWKYTAEGYYAAGLEPANCLVEGRDRERARGTLVHLEPGEELVYRLRFGILDRCEAIAAFEDSV